MTSAFQFSSISHAIPNECGCALGDPGACSNSSEKLYLSPGIDDPSFAASSTAIEIEARRSLRTNHWAHFKPPVKLPNPEKLVDGYRRALREKYPNEIATPGGQVPIDLPISPSSDMPDIRKDGPVAKLELEVEGETNDLVEYVLNQTQAAYPDETLKISGVKVGVAWNAFENLIHPDNGTYLHVTVAIRGDSTIIFLPSGVAKLKTTFDSVFKIKDIDQLGNMTVNELDLRKRTVISVRVLSPADYVLPPTGDATIITGLDRSKLIAGAAPTIHSSPIFKADRDPWERVILFIGIVRR